MASMGAQICNGPICRGMEQHVYLWVSMGSQICNGPICRGMEQPSDSFHRIKKAKDGLQDYCRDCQKEAKRRRGVARDAMPPGTPQESYPRLCNVCWNCKPPGDFVQLTMKGRRQMETLRSDCKACHNVLMRVQREARAARLAGETSPSVLPIPEAVSSSHCQTVR